MVVCPPIWIFFSLPLNIKYVKLINLQIIQFFFRMNKVPFIKFICRCVSHFFFLLLLIVTGNMILKARIIKYNIFKHVFLLMISRTDITTYHSGMSGSSWSGCQDYCWQSWQLLERELVWGCWSQSLYSLVQWQLDFIWLSSLSLRAIQTPFSMLETSS